MVAGSQTTSSTFNVRDYGAVGDWDWSTGSDDTPAFTAAIAAAVGAGGGIVYVPPGNYRVQPQEPRTDDPSVNRTTRQGHALVIDGDNITIRGAGQGHSKLMVRAYGGGDHTDVYQIVDGKVWRGGGIFITGGRNKAHARRNVTIEHLDIDGGAAYTGDNTWPATPTTGDGWDITHKGVWLQNDRHFDNITIRHCTIHHFRGEIVYGGGPYIGRVTGRHNLLHSTNGDCWSCSGGITLEDNEMHTAAGHGVEDHYYALDCSYRRNRIHNMALSGLDTSTANNSKAPWGTLTVEDNTIRNCVRNGMISGSPHNATWRRNKIIDSGTAPGVGRAVLIDGETGYTGDDGDNITLEDNEIIAETLPVVYGLVFTGHPTNVTARRNKALVPPSAPAGVMFTEGYRGLDGLPGAAIAENTAVGVMYSETTGMSGRDVPLVAGSTDVVNFRPQFPRPYLVSAHYRVTGGPADVAVALTYRDTDGTECAVVLQENRTVQPGAHPLPVTPVFAAGAFNNHRVRVTFTVAGRGQVHATASATEI